MNAWGAPQRIVLAHPSDQRADVVGNRWPSRSPAADLPRPEQPDALAMPRDDSVRLDNDECRSPIRPDATQPCPQKPIRRGQRRPLHRAVENTELVTERDDLKLKGCTAAERQQEGREEGRDYAAG